jgi:signal transduction histidine kinase
VVQLVSNLVNNAAKYMHDGGAIQIVVQAENGSAVVRAFATRGSASELMRCHGCSIPTSKSASVRFTPMDWASAWRS